MHDNRLMPKHLIDSKTSDALGQNQKNSTSLYDGAFYIIVRATLVLYGGCGGEDIPRQAGSRRSVWEEKVNERDCWHWVPGNGGGWGKGMAGTGSWGVRKGRLRERLHGENTSFMPL